MNVNHSVRLPDTCAKIRQLSPKRFGNTALSTPGTTEVLIIPTTSVSTDTNAEKRMPVANLLSVTPYAAPAIAATVSAAVLNVNTVTG